MLDKKTLPLVILLVIIVVFYYQILEFLGLYEPPPPKPATTEQVQPETDTLINPRDTITPIEIDAFTETKKEHPLLANDTLIDSVPVETTFVTTNKYIIAISNHGGGPVSLKLKDHYYRDGNLIEMIPDARGATPSPIFAGGTFSTASVPFVSNRNAGSYNAIHDTISLIYTYTSPDNGIIRKRYTFYPNQYHFDMVVELENRDKLGFERQYTMMWNTPLEVTEPQKDKDYQAMQAVVMFGGSRETLDDFEGDKLRQTIEGFTSWAGVRSKYFTAILIPCDREASGAIALGEKKKISTPTGNIEQHHITTGLTMPFANVPTITDSFTVYVGPMDYLLMSSYDVDLEAMLNIGTMPFFGMILKPFAIAIIWLLPKMYNFLPNYGVVIILFALLVKLITLPLSMRQFKSMQAMKDLAPKTEELKKKYKNDPQGLQRETMKLYKTQGVNPMSGCLVMLPQMPLMIAMFRVFQETILLRAAPFVGFIDDLSRGASGFTDPYIILVVLMIGTQFISSKLTMASGQQQQKAFIYILPLFMGFLFYSLPSGLILYWTVFSLMSLLDWFLFKRNKLKNTEVKTV